MKAFPSEHKEYKDGYTVAQDGMDLRDYFAAKAMQGMVFKIEEYYLEYLAMQSYKIADAMMKARAA